MLAIKILASSIIHQFMRLGPWWLLLLQSICLFHTSSGAALFLWMLSFVLLSKSRGCFGSFYESSTAINVDQTMLEKGKPHHVTTLSDKDFWTSSSSEELTSYSLCQTSQRSCSSSISTETQVLSDATSDTSLVQYGPALWNAGRKEWVGNRTKGRRSSQEPVINWTESYNELLGTRNSFAERIPLAVSLDQACWFWTVLQGKWLTFLSIFGSKKASMIERFMPKRSFSLLTVMCLVVLSSRLCGETICKKDGSFLENKVQFNY